MLRRCVVRQCVIRQAQVLEKDLRKALEWYGKAAAEGNTEAQYDIGTLYRDAIGTAQNYREAAYWFRKAASVTGIRRR